MAQAESQVIQAEKIVDREALPDRGDGLLLVGCGLIMSRDQSEYEKES